MGEDRRRLPLPLLNGSFSFSVWDVVAAAAMLFVTTAVVQRLTARSGPMIWPVFGILPTLLVNFDNLYEWATEVLRRSNNTFRYRGVWFGRAYGAVTSDSANVEYILKTRFHNFPKGKYYRERFRDFLGDGIFNADDHSWSEQRRTATIEMHSGRFKGYSVATVVDLVGCHLLPLVDSLSSTGRSVDLQDVLLRFTFDNICTAAFGVDVGCLKLTMWGELPEIPFAHNFEVASELSLMRFLMPNFVFKPLKAMNVGLEKRLKLAIKGVHDFAEKVVLDRIEELQNLGSLAQRCDLLSRLVEAKADDGINPKYSTKFMKDFCISFILAGRDTSSVALTWFFWLLHRNPKVESRILDELHGILRLRGADGSSCSATPTTFTMEELQKMHYLQSALSECLRLYPPVPCDFKEVLQDDVLPNGTRVRKGDKVFYLIYAMGRDEQLWGKDCREFKPERWMDGGGRFVSESQFKYLVFNAGRRFCVGKKFAYMQMKMVAASLLLRFKVLPLQGQTIVPKINTTLYAKNGIKVTFLPRELP